MLHTNGSSSTTDTSTEQRNVCTQLWLVEHVAASDNATFYTRHIEQILATPFSGTRIALGLHPKTPKGVKVVEELCWSAGASIDSYYLGDYASSGVQPPGKLSVADMNASMSGGQIYAQFSLQLNETAEELGQGLPIM